MKNTLNHALSTTVTLANQINNDERIIVLIDPETRTVHDHLVNESQYREVFKLLRTFNPQPFELQEI